MIERWLKQASAMPFEAPVAAFLGVALAFFIAAMPVELFDGYFAATGLPLLGLAGRAIAALGLAGLAAWGTWSALVAVGPASGRWTIAVRRPSFTPRRADAHPDAPARRPIFAGSELGAPLDSIRAAPPRRRRSIVARAGQPEARREDEPSPEPAALPAPAAEAEPLVVAESPASAAPSPAPSEPARDAHVLPADPAPGAEASESESESLAALMRRLEEGLARQSAAPAAPSAPAAWLVRDDRASSGRKSA